MYYSIEPKEAIALRGAVASNKKRLQEIAKIQKAINKEREVVQNDLYEGQRIRLHKGRPYWCPYTDNVYVSLDTKRQGSYRKRAVDEFFNVELESIDSSNHYKRAYFEMQVTEKQARKMCLDWILDGDLPKGGSGW